MNFNPAFEQASAAVPAAKRARAYDVPAVTATLAGMAGGLVALLSYMHALKTQIQSNQLYSGDIVKDPVYYLGHGLEIAAILGAGLIALRSTDPRRIERGYLVRFALYLGAAALMIFRGYSTSDLLSTRLTHFTGPLACSVAVLVFVGAQPANWEVLRKALMALAGILSAVTLYLMVQLQTFTRQEAITSFGPVLNALFWPAAWLALEYYPKGARGRVLRLIPLGVYALGSLFTQTRLNFVMLIALVVVRAYLDRRRGLRQSARYAIGLALVLWAVLFYAAVLRNAGGLGPLTTVGEAFYSRLDEDTRTGQLVYFFDDVEPHELLLGRGSLATWQWHLSRWDGGTDIGYLSLLFFGGLPLLLTYVAMHMAPAFSVLRARPTPLQLTAAGLVLLWMVRMFSSSYPGLAVDYYPILLSIGACISRERAN